MTQFSLGQFSQGGLRVSALKYGYSLTYQNKGVPDLAGKFFYFVALLHKIEMTITGRDLVEHHGNDSGYPPEVQRIAADPDYNFQYIEVGAGLGEYIPTLVEQKLKNKPIVIDFANYALMIEMLEYVQPYVRQDSHQVELQELIRRATVITDPVKVHLLNTRLSTALRQHPEIEGIADVVVDNYGPGFWNVTEGVEPQEVENLELQLVREGGLLYNKLYQWGGVRVRKVRCA